MSDTPMSNTPTTTHYDSIMDKVKEILGEHYPNYLFVVLDQDGCVCTEYTSVPVGRMLISEAKRELVDPIPDIDWDDDDDFKKVYT